MGLIMEFAYDEFTEGYEAVPLSLPQQTGATQRGGAAVLLRPATRPSRRAVVYVHCLGDSFVPPDVVAWYTSRGFHFYAADLRGIAGSGREDTSRAAAELGGCFAFLDATVDHLRTADGVDSVLMCAHAEGALVAALWCHARRGGQSPDALVLTSPDLGGGGSWPGRGRAARRSPALRTGAQRRLRQGLDIPCPVLVMCPEGGWDVPGGAGGLLAARGLRGGRVTIRLGEHVTWMRLEGGMPGGPLPPPAERRRFFDELSRWLSAYLSREISDQLL